VRGPTVAGDDLEHIVQLLAQHAGVPIHEDELPRVAALYEDFMQLIDTVESVDLDTGEESALALDLFAWEVAPQGPVAAHGGDAP
jgi:hypothetical protein